MVIGNLSVLSREKDWDDKHEKLFVNLHDVYYFMSINSINDYTTLLSDDSGITFIIKTDVYDGLSPELKNLNFDSRVYLRSILRFKDMNPDRTYFQRWGLYHNSNRFYSINNFIVYIVQDYPS